MRPSWKRNTPRFVRCALYLVALSPVLLSMGAAYLNHEPKGAHEVDEKSARSFRAALARDMPDFEKKIQSVLAGFGQWPADASEQIFLMMNWRAVWRGVCS